MTEECSTKAPCENPYCMRCKPPARWVGIVGTRRRNTGTDYNLVREAYLNIQRSGDAIVSGGCPEGGDHFAEIIASRFLGGRIKIHWPDNSKLDPNLPRRAAYAKICYARNTLIADDADVLIACVASDRKGGTEDTITKFCKKHDSTERYLIAEGLLILV